MVERDADARRIERLRHELDDEQIWLPADPDLLAMVLAELHYARHPQAHEGIAPRYGALLASTDLLTPEHVGPNERIPVTDIPIGVVRRLADGRSSFVARIVGGEVGLLCFDRTREYESSAVHLTVASGAVVVQRLGRGWVRLCTPQAVSTWDGIHWSSKVLSVQLTELVAGSIPPADPAVLARLLEFCIHWLGAGRVGAALVWCVTGDPHQLGSLGLDASVEVPELDLTNRAHFAPLLNALSQFDRAAVVDPRGWVSTVGVHLLVSERSRQEIAPYRGTRHTSAQRFTSDEPSAAVFVVSSGGAVSVFWQGQRIDIG